MEVKESYCKWSSASELDRKYHDNEWSIPILDNYPVIWKRRYKEVK